MSLLSQKIAAALETLDGTDAPPGVVTVEQGPHRLTLHLTASGPVGLAFDVLDFATGSRPDGSHPALRAWGDRLAARVTYLMEPLVVLEHDETNGDVELRSLTPTARGDRRAYYEVRLNRQGTLRLGRVAFDEATRRRRPASCQMTCEVLERLTDDIIASLD